MMKNAIIIVLLFFGLIVNSQEYHNDNGIFHYKNIDTTSLSSTELKSIFEKWAVNNLKNSKYAIQLNNDENIIIKTGTYLRKREI